MGFTIHDMTEQCAHESPVFRSLPAIDRVVMHRTEAGETAKEIADFYRCNPEILGTTDIPYSMIVGRCGMIEQALPLDVVSPHAMVWNRRALGIAVVGDFRAHMPVMEQVEPLRWLVYHLSMLFTGSVSIFGHDELSGSSSDPNKKCPGRYMDMDAIRKGILMDAKRNSEYELKRNGAVLSWLTN